MTKEKSKCECMPRFFRHTHGPLKGNCFKCDLPIFFEKDPMKFEEFYQSFVNFCIKKDKELRLKDLRCHRVFKP